MATTFEQVKTHFQQNKQAYLHSSNIITLVLWGIALGSHTILLPRLIHELYAEFSKRR